MAWRKSGTGCALSLLNCAMRAAGARRAWPPVMSSSRAGITPCPGGTDGTGTGDTSVGTERAVAPIGVDTAGAGQQYNGYGKHQVFWVQTGHDTLLEGRLVML